MKLQDLFEHTKIQSQTGSLPPEIAKMFKNVASVANGVLVTSQGNKFNNVMGALGFDEYPIHNGEELTDHGPKLALGSKRWSEITIDDENETRRFYKLNDSKQPVVIMRFTSNPKLRAGRVVFYEREEE